MVRYVRVRSEGNMVRNVDGLFAEVAFEDAPGCDLGDVTLESGEHFGGAKASRLVSPRNTRHFHKRPRGSPYLSPHACGMASITALCLVVLVLLGAALIDRLAT